MAQMEPIIRQWPLNEQFFDISDAGYGYIPEPGGEVFSAQAQDDLVESEALDFMCRDRKRDRQW